MGNYTRIRSAPFALLPASDFMTAHAIPYGHHMIDEADVAAVRAVLQAEADRYGQIDDSDIEAAIAVLRSPLLTQGPEVAKFEARFAHVVHSKYAVACSSGTAALHLAMSALDVGPGDVCIVPAITFLSTATAAQFCGADVAFADVDPETGLMTPDTLRDAISRAGASAKVVLPVHLGGRMCDMANLAAIVAEHGLKMIEDGCHALGTKRCDLGFVGQCEHSDATVFSFHPVKTIACGEGGMVTTNSEAMKDRIGRLRNHGVTRDPALMVDTKLSFDVDGRPNPWSYEQIELGFNYRMNEIEAALGTSQLSKLDYFVARRSTLVSRYAELLAPLSPYVEVVKLEADEDVSFHIFTLRLTHPALRDRRAELMRTLISRGVGCQVHYIPLYRQPFFRGKYGDLHLEGAELYYSSTLTLPMYPRMTEDEVNWVVLELTSAISKLLSA